MIADYQPCSLWLDCIPDEKLLLTKKTVQEMVKHRPHPAWWILSQLRTKYADRYPRVFFDNLTKILSDKCRALDIINTQEPQYNFEIVRTLLNYLYDNNHNNVVDPVTTIHQRRMFYMSPGARTFVWTPWETITKDTYKRLLLLKNSDVQLRIKTHTTSH